MESISSFDQPLLIDKELVNTSSWIYPSTFWKKTEFYEGKSVLKATFFVAWGLGQSPGGFSGGKGPNCFGFSMSLRRLNG